MDKYCFKCMRTYNTLFKQCINCGNGLIPILDYDYYYYYSREPNWYYISDSTSIAYPY